MELNDQQEMFIVEYIKTRNATEAARRVGYAHTQISKGHDCW
jgi:phage terminase small subunit